MFRIVGCSIDIFRKVVNYSNTPSSIRMSSGPSVLADELLQEVFNIKLVVVILVFTAEIYYFLYTSMYPVLTVLSLLEEGAGEWKSEVLPSRYFSQLWMQTPMISLSISPNNILVPRCGMSKTEFGLSVVDLMNWSVVTNSWFWNLNKITVFCQVY